MNDLIIDENNIKDKIYTIRNLQVMLDKDLAWLYGVETKVLNQAVKRNIKRFPSDFMFQLSKEEFENWRSQFVTSNSLRMGLRRSPYAFTEQGVSMLSAILKSEMAVTMSVKIIRAFIEMRKLISKNISIFERFERIENRLIHYDENFDKLFEALEDKTLKPPQGIFYDGQVYDAYSFINDLLKLAKSEIILIDNYVDDSVLTLLSKIPNIQVTIYTNTVSKQLKLDYEKYQKQYNNIILKTFKNSHDRFIILDKKEIFHIGASLKDLGKKWFAFSKMSLDVEELIGRLEEL
ncbi:MAG: ORF6N domain-containing protein [Arcobacteraceae bacterium]